MPKFIKPFAQIIALLLLTLFLTITSPDNAEALERDIIKTKLDNGLTVILEEDRSAPVVALQMWVRVGGADEAPDEAGIAHVFEHMLFKGTAKRGIGEIAKEVENSGGSINAYTSFDNTVYHLVVSSKNLLTGLDILSDAVQFSAFDPEELKKELEVVLEEIRMGKDNPNRNLYKTLLAASYTTHPYKAPVIGSSESVRALTREQILAFFEKWYRPDNMTLVITGDFDNKAAIKDVQRSFKDFRPSEYNLHAARSKEPEQKKFRSVISAEPIKQTHMGIAFHIPKQSHEDIYALDVAAELLTTGINSILYKRLKMDDDLVNSISSYVMSLKEPGVFIVVANLKSENLEETLKTIIKEITFFADKKPTDERLDKVKLALESDFVYSRETMQGKASRLGYYETISGDLNFEKKYTEGIRAVTPADVGRVIDKYLHINNMTVSVILPEDEATSEEATSINNKKLYKAARQGTRLAKGAIEAKSEADERKDVTKVILPGGITLLIEESRTNETIAMHASFPGGVRYEDMNNNGIGVFVAGMLPRGTSKRTREDIGRATENMATSISGFSGRNTSGLSMKFLSKFFYEASELFTDVLLNPSFTDKEVEKLRIDTLDGIKREEDYLPGYTFKLLYKELYGNHPYSMSTIGNIESVTDLTTDKLRQHHARIYRPSTMVLSIVGDIKTEVVIERMTELFKGITDDAPKEELLFARSIAPLMIIRTGVTKDKEQTNIGIGFLGTTITNEDKYPLAVLSETLSSHGGRLFTELRDKQSLAYSVSAFSREGIEDGIFGLYIGTAPEKKKAAIKGLMNELKKITNKKITEEELSRAKNSILGGFAIGLQTAGSRASHMSTNEALGLGYDYKDNYIAKISAVSRGDVLRVARKYLTLDRYVISIVGPPEFEFDSDVIKKPEQEAVPMKGDF
jgi:zinc protease